MDLLNGYKTKPMYYAVGCKCGHVGKGKFIPIIFGIKATSGEEASLLARDMPRVKHDSQDAILFCINIDEEQYRSIRIINKCDPYLIAKNGQEHNTFYYELDKRTMFEPLHYVYTRKNYVRLAESYKGEVEYARRNENCNGENNFGEFTNREYPEHLVFQNYLTQNVRYSKQSITDMVQKYIDVNIRALRDNPTIAKFVETSFAEGPAMTVNQLKNNQPLEQ